MKKIILLCLSMFLVTFYGCNKKDVDQYITFIVLP